MVTKISTGNMDNETWRKLRQTGIGGSDAGAICGVNPYARPIDVYQNKTGKLQQEEESEAIRIGHDLEKYVAERFTEATGLKVRRSNYMYRSVEHPFMLADVDRLVVGEDAGLECKTANAFNEDKWEDGRIPLHYLMQCYHYMAVTGRRTWYIAALIMGRQFVYYKITWDEEVIAGLIAKEEEFWKNHVLAKVLPRPDGTDSYTDFLNEYFHTAEKGKMVKLQGFDEMLAKRIELDDQIKALSTEKSRIEQEIKLAMGDAEKAETEGYRISWSVVTSNRLDTDRLKTERKEIYDAYLKAGHYRRLTIKKADTETKVGDSNATGTDQAA